MSTKSDVKAQRGTKRTCQNTDCGSRFYDLNRDPITCPICGSAYEVAAQHVAPTPVAARPGVRAQKRPEPFVPAEEKREAAPELEGEELPALDVEEEATVEGDEEETFLEAEDEPSDVSGIIDTPVEDTDEK
jgi:uncharacterized protein (TIGR02300 family)